MSSLRFDQFIQKLAPSLEISNSSNNIIAPAFLIKTDLKIDTPESPEISPKAKNSPKSIKNFDDTLEDIKNIVSYSNSKRINAPKAEKNILQRELNKVNLNAIFKESVHIEDLDQKSKAIKFAADSYKKSVDSDNNFDGAIKLKESVNAGENLFKFLNVPLASINPNKKKLDKYPTRVNTSNGKIVL